MSLMGTYYLIEPQDWLFPTHGDVREAKRRAELWYKSNGSYEGAEQEIEEFVRQWALKQLIDVYQYPAEWLGEKLQIEEPVKMGSTEKEADIAIKNNNHRAFLFVETKKGNVSNIEFEEAQKQLETYLAATHTATIGMVTNGTKVRCIRKKIDPNDFDIIADLPTYSKEGIATKAKLVREIPKITATCKTGLTPLSEKYEKLLFECHSVIRDTDGLHADEALDELCKVIYCKIYDERTTIEKTENAEFRFQIYGASNTAEVAANIRELYEEARNKDLEIYSKRIPNYERSRGVFKANIRLSDIALYKVVEKLQAYSFVDSNADIKGRAFQGVLSSAIRAGMGQYFTPDPIVDLAVKIVQPKPSDLILDPFCGSGHFLSKSLDYVIHNYSKVVDDYILYQFKFFHLHGIEKSDRMVRIAMTDMMLHDDGHTNIRNIDSLLSFENYPDILQLKEDDNTNPAVFDIILTNPPFGSLMTQEVMEMVGRFDLGQGKKTLPMEYIGLERCFQFLRPGGKLAIVLPDGLLKNKNSKYVRKWVEGVAEIKAVISLPEEAFQSFGAMVKTSLCIFQKLGEKQTIDENADTLLIELENVGYDATGRSKAGSEIDQAVQLFHKGDHVEMKSLKTKYGKLITEQRWDIDYHLPPIEIGKYNSKILCQISECADIVTDKRNPASTPDEPFFYVDISSVDISTGIITNPQQLIGEEAPSRARKVIREGDIIISTCRPTRGAVAIVPKELDNQICSTGFSVIRAKDGISNQYLHFILRSAVVKEQFRKFSTGSSYPAILDDDVEKTVIPLPNGPTQSRIAKKVHDQTMLRNQKIDNANNEWNKKLSEYMSEIEKL